MKKRIILCIDDEKTILDSLKIQLKNKFGKSFSYEFAESGDEGLELIDELMVEDTYILLIVSDWLMPGMKGDEFLAAVHKKYPAIVKVMLTGQADSEAVERAYRDANLFRCLHKPWTETELFDTIEQGINKFSDD